MKKKIKKYSSEFRKEAVRLALQTEHPKAVIADETSSYDGILRMEGDRRLGGVFASIILSL